MCVTHLVRDGQQHSVQLLHQLFEGRPLTGNSVPALAHHHVAAKVGKIRTVFLSALQRPIVNDATEVNGRVPAYSSCVQLEGLSMRCPSFSNLKSSSTGMPGYGEPPSVKISHMRTPNDHLRRDAGESMRLHFNDGRFLSFCSSTHLATLTRHSGVCRFCQTRLQVPSTSLAAVPAGNTTH